MVAGMEKRPWLDDGDVRVWLGDAVESLREMPAGVAQMCVTSPPFWGLRDYGTGTWTGGHDDCDHTKPTNAAPDTNTRRSTLDGGTAVIGAQAVPRESFRDVCGKCGAQRVDQQIGLEPTPDAWVDSLVAVFREVRRVLRDDGTLWLEVGDSYAGGGIGGGPKGSMDGAADFRAEERSTTRAPGLKPKDLVGAPWLLAFALRADGWFLRSDIVWARPNPMPESVTDRPTKAHSYVFLLSKRPRYFFDADAIREDAQYGFSATTSGKFNGRDAMGEHNARTIKPGDGTGGRNARSVWSIATEPTPFAHFATFPQALVERCILAGTSERGQCPNCGAPWARQVERGDLVPTDPGYDKRPYAPPAGADAGAQGPNRARDGHRAKMAYERHDRGWAPTCRCSHVLDGTPFEPTPQLVLDPFMGSGTTALVARRLGRKAVGCELSEEYMGIAARRLQQLSLLAGD